MELTNAASDLLSLTAIALPIGVEKESTLACELPFPPFLFILAI